jgi:hypothetical protein
MSNFILIKQPNEIVPCSVSFTKRLPTGETVGGSSTVVVTDADGGEVSGALLESDSVASPVISSIIKAGSDGSEYTITFTAITTPTGYKLEEEVTLQVRET